MANTLNWSPGHEGKGNYYDDGSISTWNTREDSPHHLEMGTHDGKKPQFHFYLTPEGGMHDGGITFQNRTPYTDDRIIQEVTDQDSAIYDARNAPEVEAYEDQEPRVEMGGGYGHAYNLLDSFSKVAKEEGWADFHTELKIPRGVRKKIRRWVDRLKWPEGGEKDDARRYHITILSMDEYDDKFAKWAKAEVQGKVFHFESTGMDIFAGEHVVLRFDSPEWTELVLKWQEVADSQGLEPRKFDPPKAHITIGKSPDGKWPRGVPDPHVKFDTRMFNINKNAAAGDPWQPGVWGKGLVINDEPHVWETTSPESGEMEPIHPEYGRKHDPYERYPTKQNAPIIISPNGRYAPAPHWGYGKDLERESSDPLMQRELNELDARVNSFSQHPNLQRVTPEQWEEEVERAKASPSGFGHAQNVLDILNKKTAETTPAEDLKLWLDSFTPEPAQALSPYHQTPEQFQPQGVRAPVVETPHVDPPSKPYQPYNWAEEGWEESPLDRVSAIDAHPCPECGEDMDGQLCSVCGHDGLAHPDAFKDMERSWYDRAWSKPGEQPQPTPHELHPMHWRDDSAKNVSLAAIKLMYHVAMPEAEQSIAQYGLDNTLAHHTPWSNDDWDDGVYLWDDLNKAQSYAQGLHPEGKAMHIYEVDPSGLDLQPDLTGASPTPGAYYTPQVPPENLRRVAKSENDQQDSAHTAGNALSVPQSESHSQTIDESLKDTVSVASTQYSRKDLNECGSARRWYSDSLSRSKNWRSADDLQMVRDREPSGSRAPQKDGQSGLLFVPSRVSGAASVSRWHES